MDSVLFTNTQQSENRQLTGMFCLSCEINFSDETEHKNHYRSEFHQYNLKRKMVNLPAISEERFKKSISGMLTRAQKC